MDEENKVETPIETTDKKKVETPEEKKLNAFVWIGFVLDLVGFFIAMMGGALFTIGIGVMLIGLVFSVIGLVLCVTKKGNVTTAAIYVALDVAFLVWMLFFW